MEKQRLLQSYREIDPSVGSLDSASTESLELLWSRTRERRSWSKTILIHLFFVGVNFLISGACVIYYQRILSHGPNVRYTPARSALVYEATPYDLRSIYLNNGSMNLAKQPNLLGDPSPELDANWRELLQYTDVRLTREELGEFGNDESLAGLADGSGYYAGVMAYHSLHCVQQIHRWLHREYYFPDITADESRRQSGHIAHCLDTLRQTVQCQGDTTVFPLYWGEDQPIPIGKGNTGKHECINWSRLDDWMKERSFDPAAPGVMVHPTLGPAFAPQNEGVERIGYGSAKKLGHAHVHIG